MVNTIVSFESLGNTGTQDGSYGVYYRDDLIIDTPVHPVRDEGSLGGYHREIGGGSGESTSGTIEGGIGTIEPVDGEGSLGGYHRDDLIIDTPVHPLPEGSLGGYHRDYELHPLPPEPPVRDEGSLGGYHREIGGGSGESTSGTIEGGIGIIEPGDGEGSHGVYHRDDSLLIGPPVNTDNSTDPRYIGPPINLNEIQNHEIRGVTGGEIQSHEIGDVLDTCDAVQHAIDSFIVSTSVEAAPGVADAHSGGPLSFADIAPFPVNVNSEI